jgi:hypothetical protein
MDAAAKLNNGNALGLRPLADRQASDFGMYFCACMPVDAPQQLSRLKLLFGSGRPSHRSNGLTAKRSILRARQFYCSAMTGWTRMDFFGNLNLQQLAPSPL